MIKLETKEQTAQLVLNSSTNINNFSDVRVVTLNSVYEDSLREQAYEQSVKHLNDFNINHAKIDRRVEEQYTKLKKKPMQLQQYVERTNDPLVPYTVCLNVENVDEETWHDVICALSKQEIQIGKHTFGNPVTFHNGAATMSNPDTVLDNMNKGFL